MSGAALGGLSTPFDPAYTLTTGTRFRDVVTDIRGGGGTAQSPLALFALEAGHADHRFCMRRIRCRARFLCGRRRYREPGERRDHHLCGRQWRGAAAMGSGGQAGAHLGQQRTIVSSGTRPDVAEQGIQQNQANLPQYLQGATASGNVFLNMNAQSISVVSAGRDILSGYFYVGGPGLLEVDAGRNLFQGRL